MNGFMGYLQRHRRVLLWCAGILLVYSGLGFLFVPWLAERQLVSLMEERLSLQARVETIRFNPFTFTAEIEQLNLDEADSPTLLSLPLLHVNFSPSRLLLGRVGFDEIVVTGLSLYFVRHSPTEDTLTRLGNRWAATAPPQDEPGADAENDGGIIALDVGLFRFTGGTVRYVDRVPQGGFDTTITPINIVVNDFSTREETTASTGIEITLEQDAVLTWDGRISVSPLHASGNVGLVNFPVDLPWRYFQAQLPFAVDAGRLALDFDFTMDYAGETWDLDIGSIGAAVSVLAVRENDAQDAFLTGGRLTLENGSIAIPENRAQLDALVLDGFSLLAERDEAGQLNWLSMLEAMPQEAAAPSSQSDSESTEPWQLSIGTLALDTTELRFTDYMPEQSGSIALTLDALVEGLDNQSEGDIPYTATMTVASGGQLNLDGQMQLLPAFTTDTALSVSGLSLQPAQAWLNDYLLIGIENGVLSMDARLSSSPQELFAYRGGLRLEALELSDLTREEVLASVDALTVSNLDLLLTGNSLAISEIVVDAPYARVEIADDGSTNIGGLLRSREGENVDDENDEAEDVPMTISVGEIRLNDGRSDFTDHNLPIVFDAEMRALDGQLTSFASDSTEPMRVALEGQVDEFGLVQIEGRIHPLDFERLTDIDLTFTNLDIPAMSPYTIRFAGRRIEEGRANVDLSYEITEGVLMASNSIAMRDLELGERVEHPDAMDLPLDLAVALLKNSEGVIDLNVPVSGNVGDPQFNLGPAIRTAITNALVNIVSSPFRLLASLIGGSEDAIESIRFLPGRSDIAPPEQEKLEQLIEALAQRPQLALEIPGVIAPEADRLALQTSAVEVAIARQMEQIEDPDTQLTERRRAALESLYTAAEPGSDLESLRQQHTTPADDENAARLDTLAYSEDLRQRLIEAQPVSETELENLASDRAGAVAAYIGLNGTLDASRHLMTETITSELDDDGWLSMSFDVDVAN